MPEKKDDPELSAIQTIIGVLEPLEVDARHRVIDYVFQRLTCPPKAGSPAIYVKRSRGTQNTKAEQIEIGAAIHLMLDRFQTIDLSFDLPITPFRR